MTTNIETLIAEWVEELHTFTHADADKYIGLVNRTIAALRAQADQPAQPVPHQEFYWLIEGRDSTGVLYATCEKVNNEWKWTRTAHKAAKFPSEASAESVLYGTDITDSHKNGGHLTGYLGAREHGFIT